MEFSFDFSTALESLMGFTSSVEQKALFLRVTKETEAYVSALAVTSHYSLALKQFSLFQGLDGGTTSHSH